MNPSSKSAPQPRSGQYDSAYAAFQSDLYAQIRREAYGQDIGQNSWLTSDEQDRFIGWLGVSAGKSVLDVACGAGGPALRMAVLTRCSIIGIDVHEQAISSARSAANERGLSQLADFRVVNATGPLPFSDSSFDAISCIDAINHFPDRPQILADWARLLKPAGRLLFTDPITLTGPLTSSEISIRSSSSLYVFVPLDYDKNLIAQCGLRLLRSENVTGNMARIAKNRCSARASRASDLRKIEGDHVFESQQEFLATAARIAQEGRLSRFVYVAEKE